MADKMKATDKIIIREIIVSLFGTCWFFKLGVVCVELFSDGWMYGDVRNEGRRTTI